MFSTDAPPSASDLHPERKPLSTLGSIGVAGTTAAIVFIAGVYIAERGGPGTLLDAPAADVGSSAAVSSGPAPAAPPLTARARVVAAVAAIPSAGAGGQQPPGASSNAPTAPPPAQTTAARRSGYGSLRVVSERSATVYVTGVTVGPTNQPLEARCGRFFVRIGEPTPKGPRWLGEGRTVVIDCNAATEVAF